MNTQTIKQQRVIVVTGGGTGIGRAIATRFAQNGERVILIGRRKHILQTAVDSIGGTAEAIVADVCQRADIERVVAQIGQIDVLVNNAGFVLGVSADMPLADAEANWDAVINTNLKGSFLMSIASSQKMPESGGRIINISSIAAFTGGSRGGAIEYAASKAGMHGLTMGLARDLGHRGITVNAIAPGLISQTEFTGHWPEARFQAVLEKQPVKKIGRPEDIAAAAFYLASAEAQFVTGEILSVNGGWLFGR